MNGIQVYAAQRLLEDTRDSNIIEASRKILVTGCNSPNPHVRVYSLAKLWSRENQLNLKNNFISQYRHTLESALKDSSPEVKRLAAERVGLYQIKSLAPQVLKLLEKSQEIQVRFQALAALGWMEQDFEEVVKIAKG